MPTSPSPLDLIRDAYDAFNRGDVSTVLDLMDENVSWHEMDGFPYRGTHRGPDGVLENVFEKIGEEWEVWQATPSEYVDGGDTVVVLGEYSATYKKTGKSMRSPFAHVWKMRDGKVHEFRQYTDTVLVQRALEGEAREKAA